MSKIRPIAVYLPQFHAIPENDSAWGKGFTEWTNVKKAVPLFNGHYQPHVPHENVGYYDLNDPEVLVRQAAMAKKYGIYGFAYYHYWFNGKLLLEAPLENMLKSEMPDFPFCYIWANENWTKKWDGLDKDIIIKQEYSFEDDLKHIKYLCSKVFCDKRYIKIDDKPVFIVYRTELFPNIRRTATIWREEAIRNGYKDIYLIRVENFVTGIDPVNIGFDAAMEFAPNGNDSIPRKFFISSNNNIHLFDYNHTVFNMIIKRLPYKCYRTVFPSWDNTPRRGNCGIIFNNIHPLAFEYFLKKTIEFTNLSFADEERILFINAWNEWGEGCHIEPDKLNGYKYLEVCRNLFTDNAKKQYEIEKLMTFFKEIILFNIVKYKFLLISKIKSKLKRKRELQIINTINGSIL